jgi:F-box and WD-40 domain protein 1/11
MVPLFLQSFESFIDDEQLDLVMQMLSKMRHSQHGQINSYLRPMLQRDFITLLPGIF